MEADPSLTTTWAAEAAELRRIALDCGLAETVKWAQPCFTHSGKNIAIMGSRKGRIEFSFLRGALLTDPAGMLEFAGPNSRNAKLAGFTDRAEVLAAEPRLRAFIAEAVTFAQENKRVPAPKASELVLIEEIHQRLDRDPELKAAFEALTPGRRRAYNIVCGGAKQSATRARRFEGFVERIHLGKGPQDCVCGRSKRMPRCDGTHKHPA